AGTRCRVDRHRARDRSRIGSAAHGVDARSRHLPAPLPLELRLQREGRFRRVRGATYHPAVADDEEARIARYFTRWTISVPRGAWGPEPIEWFEQRRPVYAWVFTHRHPPERVQAWAHGANSIVVLIQWIKPVDGDQAAVVYRPAVTHRALSARGAQNLRL